MVRRLEPVINLILPRRRQRTGVGPVPDRRIALVPDAALHLELGGRPDPVVAELHRAGVAATDGKGHHRVFHPRRRRDRPGGRRIVHRNRDLLRCLPRIVVRHHAYCVLARRRLCGVPAPDVWRRRSCGPQYIIDVKLDARHRCAGLCLDLGHRPHRLPLHGRDERQIGRHRGILASVWLRMVFIRP